jgi:hypothetical protein
MKMPQYCYEDFVEKMLALQAQGYPISDVFGAADRLWKNYLNEMEQAEWIPNSTTSTLPKSLKK